MSKTSSWLDPTPVPDVVTLNQDELLDVWAANRQNTLGRMAAEEGMKRLYNERKEKKNVEGN